ncbi:hypothetical protein LINPERPRIM_LOCUS21042, partial [Linum perenne]
AATLFGRAQERGWGKKDGGGVPWSTGEWRLFVATERERDGVYGGSNRSEVRDGDGGGATSKV